MSKSMSLFGYLIAAGIGVFFAVPQVSHSLGHLLHANFFVIPALIALVFAYNLAITNAFDKAFTQTLTLPLFIGVMFLASYLSHLFIHFR